MKTYDKLSKIEMIMGEKATTAFELEKETANWKLKNHLLLLCDKIG